jgi:asparagine synthase (glutamine-hydrolysing)
MCGIAGTVGFGDPDLLRAMTDTLAHRGPDGDGYFVGDGVCLGNRRLAILDVAGGQQPMTSEDGSVVVVYNGETYYYPALREQVLRRGHRLTTTCDTELLPHLYADEGIGFVARLDGIFAFALLDRRTHTLYLVRDPLGVKPLVYAAVGDKLAFGSESKAVLTSGLVDAELDEASPTCP